MEDLVLSSDEGEDGSGDDGADDHDREEEEEVIFNGGQGSPVGKTKKIEKRKRRHFSAKYRKKETTIDKPKRNSSVRRGNK